MIHRLIPWVLIAAAGALHAQAPAPASGFAIRPVEAYDVSKLPDDHYGRLVKYGKELTDRTFAYIGPEVKDAKMRYAGNNLACASCHQAGATKKFAMPWVGAHATFPQYRAREDEVSTVAERQSLDPKAAEAKLRELGVDGRWFSKNQKTTKAYTTVKVVARKA